MTSFLPQVRVRVRVKVCDMLRLLPVRLDRCTSCLFPVTSLVAGYAPGPALFALEDVWRQKNKNSHKF